MATYGIGVDLGGTRIKAVALSGDGEVLGQRPSPGVPGSGEYGRSGVVLVQLPCEGVLPAPPADDQNPHFFFMASENAWAARFAVSTTSFTTAFASFI